MNQDDLRRTVGAAIMLARSDCCDVCRALIRVRDQILEAVPDPTAGLIGHAPPAPPAPRDGPSFLD